MPVLVDERVGMPRVAKEHRSQNERQGRVLQDGHHGGEFGIYARLLPRVLLRVLSVQAAAAAVAFLILHPHYAKKGEERGNNN